MHYQGFIFDFNGTLYRDDAYQKAAWGVISSRLRGGRALTEEEMVQHVNGWPGAAVFRYLLGRPLPQQEVWRLLGEKEAIYRELCQKDAANFRLIAGAEGFLDALKRKGVPMTIATGSEIVNVRFFMEQFRLDRWFALERIVYDDGQLPGKPNPEIYQKAAANLGLPPEACVVAEDAPAGVAAARAAGIGRILAVAQGEAADRMAALPGVDKVMADFTALDADALFGSPAR